MKKILYISSLCMLIACNSTHEKVVIENKYKTNDTIVEMFDPVLQIYEKHHVSSKNIFIIKGDKCPVSDSIYNVYNIGDTIKFK